MNSQIIALELLIMSLVFDITNYRISCQYFNKQLAIRLQPLNFSNIDMNYYFYEARHMDDNIPEELKFIFNNSVECWFKYIEFYQSKHTPTIKARYPRIIVPRKSPFFLQNQHPRRFKNIQAEAKRSETAIFKLASKVDMIDSLKNMLEQKQNKIKQMESQITRMRLQVTELQVQNQRIKNQMQPRKLIHFNQPYIQLQKTIDQRDDYECNDQPLNQENHNYSSSSNKERENYSNQQFQTLTENHVKNGQIQLSNNQTIILEKYNIALKNDNHPQEFPNYMENLMNQSQVANQFDPTEIRINNVSANLQKETSRRDQNNVNGYKKQNNDPTAKTFSQKISNNQQNIHLREINNQVSEDKFTMIRQFVSKKCLLQVGYDDKGYKKHGYCCIFCQKIFKEDEFLSKHFFSRHPEIINDFSLDFLNLNLINFKKKREQRALAAQNNATIQRKSIKLDNVLNKLTMK